jgi:hypothetical protein
MQFLIKTALTISYLSVLQNSNDKIRAYKFNEIITAKNLTVLLYTS